MTVALAYTEDLVIKTPDVKHITASKMEGKVNQPPVERKLPSAVALGALALGALAIGAIAIGKLIIRKATIKKLHVGELSVDQLKIKS